MALLDRIPAIRKLDSDRADLLAIEIAGEVTGADVENLCGLLEAAYALHPRIDLFVVWATDEEVDWREVSGDTLKELRDGAREHIARCAAVGGSGDISTLLHSAGDTSATEFRRFGLDEADAAWAWLEGHAAP